MNVLAAIILVVIYLLCIVDEYRPNLLKIIGIDLLVAGGLKLLFFRFSIRVARFFLVYDTKTGKNVSRDFFLFFSGFFASIAILVFAAKADGPEFMPDYEQNYLSW
jgi:hypothetical protein